MEQRTMNLEEIKKIEDESKLETILLNVVNEQINVTLEFLKAQQNRQTEIEKQIRQLKEIESYLVKKLNYNTRSRK